jgi:hypothetical protein
MGALMLKKLAFVATIIGSLFGVSTAANAALVIVPGSAGVLPGNYDPTPAVPGVAPGFAGSIGAVLHLTAFAVLKFEYLGKEASFNNRFHFDLNNDNVLDASDVQFSTGSTAPGSSFMAAMDTLATYETVIPFAFGWNSTSANVLNILRALATSPNIFMAFDPNNAGSVLLFLDDSGAGPDVDFDDMIIRVSIVSEVPEPATIGMVGLALLMIGGFFAYGRRRAGVI